MELMDVVLLLVVFDGVNGRVILMSKLLVFYFWFLFFEFNLEIYDMG